MVVVRLPRVVLRVVDPAGAYLEPQRPRRFREPVYRGGVVFGPGVPGGSRQATPEEIEEMRLGAEEAERERLRAAPPVDRAEVARAVADLLATGEAVLGEGPRTVHARVVRFWRGSSILELSNDSGTGWSSSRTPIPRDLGHDEDGLLADYLVHFVEHLDP